LQDAAEQDGIELSGKTCHIIDGVFGDAIGKAVKAFETMMTIEIQHRHDEYLAFLLHDLRTPLEALSLAATLLERSLPDHERSPAVDAAISVLRGNINRLSKRVRHVLSTSPRFGKTSPPQFVRLNLRGHVEKVARDFGPLAASADTQIRNEVDEQLEVYTDELLLGQILENLLANALKFTSNGIIQIGAREINDGRAVECWVKDTGQGIPPAKIDKVFERFETGSDPEHSGMGLGLAIVKEIVLLHKGEVRVQSEVGSGSTFTFVLPAEDF
jgi:two-component system phosphate regulon sensor histidine kinase PhoR